MSRRKTTEQFIEEAKRVHGDKYDYSNVTYINNKVKVEIICPKHKSFFQTPNDHLNGCGCKDCWEEKKKEEGTRRKTLEQFIKDAKKVHGEEYDYSKTVYINGKTPIIITHNLCKKDFSQKPSDHLDGCGCIFCYKTPKKTTEQFIKEAKEKHGDKFDYSLVDYQGNKTKVKIICNKCKKTFEQTPLLHLRGNGCPNCAPNKKFSQEEFIEACKKVHGNKYDYSITKFKSTNSKIEIICPKHGVFSQNASNHLGGHGCKECRKEFLRKKFAMPIEEFIRRANIVHHSKYDYSKVEYVNSSTLITIICPEHGEFQRSPSSHLLGCGCPWCDGWKGEMRIAAFLKNNNIKFIPQKTFDNLKDFKNLSYDFYIKKYNLLIEYNGGQHYEFTPFFHKDLHDFHRQLHHDWLKRKYARDKKIDLLIIPFWEYDNIDIILDEFMMS